MTMHKFSTARLATMPATPALSTAHVQQLLDLLTPGTLHFLPDDWQQCPHTADQLTDWITDKLTRCELLLVQDKQTHILGLVMLYAAENTVQLGYLIGEAHWGQGYASELLQGLVAHLRTVQPNITLNAGVAADNPASIKVLEKAGFVRCPSEPGNTSSQLYYTLPTE
ncbi:GNAT family N-acetyltransferase [Pseudoalteromonas rubra]|uniref:GNAT family N-acetyltransferase n=1 Tax=Pseudoalteromonas rubra TaxID=43658 RepID=UPI000F7B6054|nr:GNAT family N-acetyltransferase [Pseudoalteromonas rubra]